jgi:hypothetical protein
MRLLVECGARILRTAGLRVRDSRDAMHQLKCLGDLDRTDMATTPRTVTVLLNVAHALDHMLLLIFAAAVSAIAADFGFARWEDLMPYGVGAFCWASGRYPWAGSVICGAAAR